MLIKFIHHDGKGWQTMLTQMSIPFRVASLGLSMVNLTSIFR